MPSLSLVQWLLVGNIALLVIVGFFLFSLLRQQHQQGRRIQERIGTLENTQLAINKTAVGVGRRLKQFESRLQQVQRSASLPGTDDATFAQASRLVNLGANATELMENCGMARGEAELLVSLKRAEKI